MTTLTLVRLVPRMVELVAWARGRDVPIGADDSGYAVHAALRATLGDVGPQPWTLRPRASGVELLGYSTAAPEEVNAARLLSVDPEAAHALGLSDLTAAAMPIAWQMGMVLSFETRVRPVVRESRTKSELDAAVAARSRSPGAERAHVYHEWLARELARGNAAELISSRLVSFRRVKSPRRTHSTPRAVVPVEGPDAVMRGELRIREPSAMKPLLSRGIGRHRAFGFGCLLLAPRGVLR